MNPGSHPNYALNILVGFILPLVPQTYRCFRVEPRRTPQSQRATRLLSWPHQTLLMLTVAPLGDTDCSLSFLLLPSQPPPLLTSAPEGSNQLSLSCNCPHQGCTYTLSSAFSPEHYRGLSSSQLPQALHSTTSHIAIGEPGSLS